MKYRVLLLILMFCGAVEGRQRVAGNCERGGVTATVSGTGYQLSSRVQASYPSCTVTVYRAGTTTPATIYADDAGTVKGNPFQADTDGGWFFYADNGRYDVRFSGGGIAAPYTRGDHLLFDLKELGVYDVKQYGAAGDGLTDDTAALNGVIASNRAIFLPCGTYRVTGKLNIIDRANVVLYGAGNCTVIRPSANWPDNTNLLDVSGSKQVVLRDFEVDGTNIVKPNLQLGLIYGDGTATNPTYGQMWVTRLVVRNWEQQGFGIGANGGMTVEDIYYTGNVFLNASAGAVASHPIDTGAAGTKKRFTISGNSIVFGTPANPDRSTGGNGIFAGHGKNYDFTISNNKVVGALAHGISVYNRPYAGEACEFVNAVVSGNTVDEASWDGIAVFGGKNITIQGNTIRNPGQSSDPLAVHDGISVSHGTSGATNVPASNVVVTGNAIIDDQVTPTMQYGVVFGNNPGYEGTGLVGLNAVSGATIQDVYLWNTDNQHVTVLTHQLGKTGVGLAGTPAAAMDLAGDVLVRHPESQTNFAALIAEATGAESSWLTGMGSNIRYNRTTQRWEAFSDAGVNDGFAAVMNSISDGHLRFYLGESNGLSSGANPRQLTNAEMQARLKLVLHDTGALVFKDRDTTFRAALSNDPLLPSNVFVGPLIQSGTLPTNFLMGWGLNITYNPATAQWESGYDDVNNGFGAVVMTQADGALRFVSKTSTGGTQQSVLAADLWNYEQWRMGADGYLYSKGRTYAELLAAPGVNGAMVYCSNCTRTSPCAGSGTGAFAKRLNGLWECN